MYTCKSIKLFLKILNVLNFTTIQLSFFSIKKDSYAADRR